MSEFQSKDVPLAPIIEGKGRGGSYDRELQKSAAPFWCAIMEGAPG